MKKLFFILLSFVFTSAAFSQTKSIPKDTTVKYSPAPDKRFSIDFSAQEFDFFMICAQYGFQPYVKTTSTPVNQIETLQQNYGKVIKEKFDQFRKQYLTDSLQHAKPKH